MTPEPRRVFGDRLNSSAPQLMLTSTDVSEFGVEKPGGCESDKVVEPGVPSVIGTCAVPEPGGIATDAGTLATEAFPLFRETAIACEPATT